MHADHLTPHLQYNALVLQKRIESGEFELRTTDGHRTGRIQETR
ncbi:hypothetical protein RMSM_05125 [Rhodopirellula maiorica SM1]|uniref:Uncharacterized protein n=1 Tax=Rhodopirellula maiorica SM1 TaxID=1265738 RepID=M5REQ0_9BACT|nr:hypothetical protein RMSM_05125 [Rhodopirellula maiorica SM1]